MIRKIITVAAILFCSTSQANDYNRTFYTYSDPNNTVKVAKVVQTLHLSTSGIWYLKQNFTYVSGRGTIPTAYKCFNGYPYNPLENLSQSWLNTNSSLRGCERAKQELMKQHD
jgi:hypothetical protein